MTSLLRPRPEEASPRPWKFPATEHGGLASGVRVVLCSIPERPVIEVRVVYSGGARREPTDLMGLGSIATRAISEGTARRDANDFNDAMESLGANFGVSVEWEAVVASLSAPQRRLAPALSLFAEALYDPGFRDEDVERLTRQSIVGLVNAAQFPGPRAELNFARATFAPGSRMAVVGDGTPETLARLTPEAVRAFWTATSAAPNATVVVVGDLRGVPVEAILDETFGSAGVDVVDDRPAPGEEAPTLRNAVVVDFPGAVQSHIVVGHAGPALPVEQRAVAGLASHYLGGFFSSRLNTVLREEKSLTYGVGSAIDHRGSASLFKVQTAVQRDATAEALRDIRREIDDLACGRISEELFGEAVANLTRTGPITLRSTGAIAATLVRTVQEGLPDNYFDVLQEQLRAATNREMVDVFARHVRLEDLCVVICGDRAAFEEELAADGLDFATEPAVGPLP